MLLVEDEAGVREVVAERLRALGYRVLEAADGPAALRLLRGNVRVDLLVTDVGLPGGLNGRQLADMARERRPALPVRSSRATRVAPWRSTSRRAWR